MTAPKNCTVIGAGPAGLMAADVLSQAGCTVTVFEQMPSAGRKFLMAGIGGLNLTHSEDPAIFKSRYRGMPMAAMIDAFSAEDVRAWADGLGQDTFVGSSGRVFPRPFKASPLLRAWLLKLEGQGVTLRTRHRWTGWQDGAATFHTPDGPLSVRADATILALGGASWPKLGSDGAWRDILGADTVVPFQPSNCGFITGWAQHVGTRFGGTPLKPVALSFDDETVLGEIMITEQGLEGGAVYALSPLLRDAIAAQGSAVLTIDLKPDMDRETIAERLATPRKGDSLSNRLRKALKLPPAAVAVLREGWRHVPTEPPALAHAIKAVPITLTAPTSLDRAISTAGGVRAQALDSHLMLTARPGVFVAGEMLDWEAPTGGYLLQACFASGRWAANGALDWLGLSRP